MRIGMFNKTVSVPIDGYSARHVVPDCAGCPGPAAADPSQQLYIYVSSMGNIEFFNAHKYGWKWGGEALGVKTTYVGPTDYDINAMVAAFDQAIAKKPKGIVVFAVDPGLTPSINKASEAGIPVVTILGDLPESKRIAYVGSSQHDLGYRWRHQAGGGAGWQWQGRHPEPARRADVR